MKLIDTHAHLEQIENLDQTLKNTKDAGVEAIIAVGVDGNSNKRILEIASSEQPVNPAPRDTLFLSNQQAGSMTRGGVKIFPALGIHPGEIKTEEIEEAIKFIEQNISKLVAVGEIGLDFWYSGAKRPEKKQQQIDIFKRQLLIAKKNNLPVSIHSRGAWEECISICSELEIEKAVFHWYSGPVDILKLALDRGYFVSFTPALEYSPQHQEAAKFSPLDKIMLETDSPVRFKESSIKDNAQPRDVFVSLRALSKMKSISEEKLSEQVFKNSINFFNLAL